VSRGGGGQIAEEVSHAGELLYSTSEASSRPRSPTSPRRRTFAPRTFFGYFPSKEDVVFADFPAEFDALAERLRGRDEGESAIDALRDFIAEALERADLTDERELCRKRIMKESEALDAHRRALMGRMEDMLSEAVARDFGDRPGDLRPPMIASAAVAALGSLDRTGISDPRSPPTREEALAMIDQALTFLQGGLAALQRK
jgi:hypothetical protein